MEVFSFLKNAGAKIFGKEEPKVDEATIKAAEAKAREEAVAEARRKQQAMLLNGVVSSLGISVENLNIEVNGDTATLYGQTETQADKERVILAVGNVEGIASVDDRISVVRTEPEAVFYEVQRGDSLSKIAKAHYGDPMRYPEIFEANKPMLSDPDKIYPGQMLRIPQ